MRKRGLFACLLLVPACFLQAGTKPVSFEQSMRRSAHFSPTLAKEDAKFGVASKLYTSYIQKHRHSQHAIPRYIHIIQLGGWPPGYVEDTIQTWRTFHPDFEVMLWMDRDVPLFQLKNKHIFDTNQDPRARAAIWSYEILDRFGGIYVDINCECLKSLNSLRKSCSFFVGMAHGKEATLSNHIIGAPAGHPILKACIASIEANPGDLNVGSPLLTRCFFAGEADLAEKPVVFPVTYFSPLPPDSPARFQTVACCPGGCAMPCPFPCRCCP